MFYHEQDIAVHRPGGYSLCALMLLDPSLLPSVPKPQEDDMQDAKMLYYYSSQPSTVHTKRYQIGLAEGMLLVFGSFSDAPATKIEVDIDNNRFSAGLIEENLLLAVVVEKHPDTVDDIRDWGLGLIEAIYQHWRLFYGNIKAWRNPQDQRLGENFKVVMDNFISQFIKFSSTNDDETLISPSRLYPKALERFSMQKSHFLITNQIENILKVAPP
jgi:hypothetical protein